MLESLKATSIAVTDTTNRQNSASAQLTTTYAQERDALVRLADQTKTYDGTLTGLITRLNAMRSSMTQGQDAMNGYVRTLRDATAASLGFNATIEGLDRYVAKTRELNITIRDTATGLATITAAQQNLTVAGHNARVALESLGVSLSALNPANANPATVLTQLADWLRGVQANQFTLNQAQQVLGPSFDAQALQRLQAQPYVDYRTQTQNTLNAQTQAQIDAATAQTTRRQAELARQDARLADLRSRYGQSPTLASRLGLDIGGRVGRFFGQTDAEEQLALERINVLPANQRNQFEGYGARIGDFFQTGYAGQTLRQLTSGTYGANQADINQRFAEERRNFGLVSAIGNFAGRSFQNLPGIQSYVPRTRDERPISAEEQRARRRAAGAVLGQYGDTDLERELGFEEQARQFQTPEIRQRYTDAYGQTDGARRFQNRLATLQEQQRIARSPEEATLEETRRRQEILAVAPEDRARAQFLQQYRIQQVGTAGTLSPEQQAAGQGAFRQGVDEQLQRSNEETQRQIEFQKELSQELEKGRGVAEDYTRAWAAFTQAKLGGATQDEAELQALNAIGLAMRQRITQATAMTVQMREQNQLTRERVDLARSTSSLDPVARAVAANDQAIIQQVQQELHGGTLPSPAGGTFGGRSISDPGAQAAVDARIAQLRDQALQAARTHVGDNAALSDAIRDSQTIVNLMNEQGISLEKANAQLQQQKRYYDELAAARAKGDTDAITAAERQLELAQQLQRIQSVTDQQAKNVEAGRQAQIAGGSAAGLSLLRPEDQERARVILPLLQQNLQSGNIGAGGGPPRWIDRPEAQPYLPMINEQARRTGMDPAVLAELIGQESGFRNVPTEITRPDGSKASSASGLGQQIEGNVYLHGGNPRDPATSIRATAEEFTARLRAAGGNLDQAAQTYGVTANVSPQRRAAVLSALHNAAGDRGGALAGDPTQVAALLNRALAGQLDPPLQAEVDRVLQGAGLTRQAGVVQQGQLLTIQQDAQRQRTELLRQGRTGEAARIAVPTTAEPLQRQFEAVRGQTETETQQRQTAAAAAAALEQQTKDTQSQTAALAANERQQVEVILQQKVDADVRQAGSGIIDKQADAIRNLNALIAQEGQGIAETTKSIREQIAAQEAINAAIPRGSEAVRDATDAARNQVAMRRAQAELDIAQQQGNAAGVAAAQGRIKALQDEADAAHRLNVESEKGQALSDTKRLTDRDETGQALNARGPFASDEDLRRTAAMERLRQRFRDEPGLEGSPEGQQLRAATERDQDLQDQTDRMNELRNAAHGVEGAFANAFDALVVHGEKGKEVLKGLAQTIEEIILKTLVYKPLERLANQALTALFGGDEDSQGGGQGNAKGGAGGLIANLLGGGGGGGGNGGGGGGNATGGLGGLLGRLFGGGGGGGGGPIDNGSFDNGGANDNTPARGGDSLLAGSLNSGGGALGASVNPGPSGGGLASALNHPGGLIGWGVDSILGQGAYKGGGLIGQLFGGGGGTDVASAAIDSGGWDIAAARGGVFPGKALAAYEHSIVDMPTTFRFARGGSVGLMGEAGPEAIIPLSRGADGKLGLSGGGGGPQVVFNIQTPNADSFQRSQPQIHARATAALSRTSMRS